MTNEQAKALGYNMEAHLKYKKALIALILSQPFSGTLATWLQEIEDKTAQTAWTDGVNIGYNPDYIMKISADQLKGLICHEVMHVALLHHTRIQNREPKKWNIAGDAAINPLIPFPLPPGGINIPQFHEKSAEEIYSLLPDMPKGGSGGKNPGEVRQYPKKSKTAIKQEEIEQKINQQQALKAAKIQGKLPAGLERLINDNCESTV